MQHFGQSNAPALVLFDLLGELSSKLFCPNLNLC